MLEIFQEGEGRGKRKERGVETAKGGVGEGERKKRVEERRGREEGREEGERVGERGGGDLGVRKNRYDDLILS